MDRARILPGQDTPSRGVSRRIDQWITGYTQSAGFEGCIESWICARCWCVRVRARARHLHACATLSGSRLDYGSWKEAISKIPGGEGGETDSSIPSACRRLVGVIIEKSKTESFPNRDRSFSRSREKEKFLRSHLTVEP